MNEILISALSTIITALLSVALAYLSAWLKAKYTSEQIAKGKEIASIAVQAVEKIAETTGWHGEQKYQEAVKYIAELTQKAGLKLSEEQVKALIESAVHQLDQAWEEP